MFKNFFLLITIFISINYFNFKNFNNINLIKIFKCKFRKINIITKTTK